MKEKIINFTKKPIIRVIITLVLIAAAIIAGVNLFGNNNHEEIFEEQAVKQVKILEINNKNTGSIDGIGSVKADTKISVRALTSGTVRNVNFEVGNEVYRGKSLASISNESVLLNYLNAQTNYTNLEKSNSITLLSTEESKRLAELSVQSAREAVTAQEISLQTAQDNLVNASTLKDKSNDDLKNNAVISVAGHLNTVFSTLKTINTIIQAEEDGTEVAGIKNTLAALNTSTLGQAITSYRQTENSYKALTNKIPTPDNIISITEELVSLLTLTKQSVDSTITVLENTVSSADFSESTLSTNRTTFISLRSSIVATQTTAETTLQSLQNSGLINTQDITSLENAISAAENRLDSAKTNLKNAETAFENRNLSIDLEIISTQNALSSAKNQLNLAQIQYNDLSIIAPISGVITARLIEIGSEVNPSDIIAEISQTDNLIIEVDLPAEDVVALETGQLVNINPKTSEITGTISQIYPTADPINKKVRIEIAVENKNKDLIAESFVSIVIPIEKIYFESAELFLVPIKAVTISPNENYVFIFKEGKAEKKVVELGRTEGSQIEITNGLNIGDKLVIEGNKNINENEEILIIN